MPNREAVNTIEAEMIWTTIAHTGQMEVISLPTVLIRPGPDLTDTSMVWMIPESR